MDTAKILRSMRTRRVVLRTGTVRARILGAIGPDQELAVTIRAVSKGYILSLGTIPSLQDIRAAAAEIPREVDDDSSPQKKHQADPWLIAVLAAAIVEPAFVVDEPDADAGAIGPADLVGDIEVLAWEILTFSGITHQGAAGTGRTAEPA